MVVEGLRLDGRTAIVCGAGGGGIGTATSLALSEAGANVVAVDIVQERVDEIVGQITAMGNKAHGIVADVEKKSEAQRVVDEAAKAFGAVHHVANIIGGMTPNEWSDILNYGEAEWDSVLSRNLRYQFFVCQAAANHMVKNGIRGSIASLASVSGWAGAPMHGPYGAAKAGVMALTRTMAVELGKYGIRVNAVAPGSIRTPRTMAGTSDEARDASARRVIPLQRTGRPEEIAAALLFLLSDLASYVSGHTLVVDGAVVAKFGFQEPEQDDPRTS